MHFNTPIQFRRPVYDRLGPARDALFELGEAVSKTASTRSFVELSTCPVFRRRWSSAYAALQDGRPDCLPLPDVYLAHLPAPTQPLLAGDHTA